MQQEPPKIPQSNYTQIPNVFFDEIMPRLKSLAEMKVMLAVMRQTFGFHKRADLLSISQIQRLTGLSHQSALDGVKGALEKGILRRKEKGQSYLYAVNIQTPENPKKVVKNLDQSDGEVVKNLDYLSSQEFRPEVVKNLDQSASQEFRPTKETLSFKEKKESTTPIGVGESAFADVTKNQKFKKQETANGIAEKVPVDHPVFVALCRAVGVKWDSSIPTKEQRINLTALAKSFVKDGETPGRIETAYRNMKQSFRWKGTQPISIADFRAHFHSMVEGASTPNAGVGAMTMDELRAETARVVAERNANNSQGANNETKLL